MLEPNALFYTAKQPAEETSVRVDCTGFREITSGETITGITVTCTPTSIVKSYSFTTTTISIRLQAGTDGQQYHITALLTTSGGHKREVDLMVRITEMPES